MKNLLKQIIVPTCSFLIVMIGISYFDTFVSLRLSTKHFNTLIAGIIYSSYYAGIMIGATFIKKVIRKIGHRYTFILSGVTVSCIFLIQSFIPESAVWILFRFITGGAVAGLYISIESWLLILSNPKTRGIVLSFYMISLYTAICLGQFGIAAVPVHSSHPFILALVFTIISILPVALFKKYKPKPLIPDRIKLITLYKKTPLGFTGNFAAGMILGAFYMVGPVCAKMTTPSLMHISIYMAVTILGGLIMQFPMGKLSDHIQRRLVIMLICSFIFIISVGLIISFDLSYSVKLILHFFLGGVIFTLYPISLTYCCDFLSSTKITAITAAGVVNYGFGSILGPLIALLFVKTIGAVGFYYFTASIGLMLLLFATYRKELPPHLDKE